MDPDKVNWEEHLRSGHWPPHRRRRTCIVAMAQGRSHRRSAAPGSYTLGVDVIGPYHKSPDEISLQRRYALVATYLLPVTQDGKPLLTEAQEQGTAEEEAEMAELSQEVRDWFDDLSAGAEDHEEGDAEAAAEARVCGIQKEGVPSGVEGDDSGGKSAGDVIQEVYAGEAKGLKWSELVFTELLDNKAPKTVTRAIGRIHAQLIELGLPLARTHGDAGREFTEPPLRDYAAERGIMFSHAAPTEHDSNGRVENTIRRLKGMVRVHIQNSGKDKSRWPMALKAAAHEWRTRVLGGLGYPVKPTVPYGSKVQVLVRPWLRRRQKDWGMKAQDATVVGPSSSVRNGYVVEVGKRLYIVTKLFFGEASHLKVRVGTGAPVIAVVPSSRRRMRAKGPEVPTRRVHGKSSLRAVKADRLREGLECEDARAASLAEAEDFDSAQARAFLAGSKLFQTQGSKTPSNCSSGQHFLFGSNRHGGALGATKLTQELPGFAKLLARLVREVVPHATYTTLSLSVNAKAVMHKDRCGRNCLQGTGLRVKCRFSRGPPKKLLGKLGMLALI